MTKRLPPPLFLVGTRFQAMMTRGILEHLRVATYDLVVYHQEGGVTPDEDFVLSALIRDACRVTRINRKQSTRRQFYALVSAAGRESRTVYLAQIAMPFVLLLFKLRPDMRLRTFDEGSYNVAPDGPFHAPSPRKLRRFYDIMAFALFPKGTINFVRSRTERHFTAFPPEKNILSTRAERVDIPWTSFIKPSEADMARTACKIMVLPCMKDFTGPSQFRDAIISASQDCDLVVRHPRDDVVTGLVSLQLSSPVESIISSAARHRPVKVLHCASTVELTLAGKPNIALINISRTLKT